MRKDNINKKTKKAKKKITLSDKAAGVVFEKIINALLDKYEPFRNEMTFEEYCRKLVGMSVDKRTNANNPDEPPPLDSVEEGETVNGRTGDSIE